MNGGNEMKTKGENQSVEDVEQVETTVQNETHTGVDEDSKPGSSAQETSIVTPGTKQNKVKEEKVTFRLFKDNDKYKAPVFVGVNGIGYLVERGKDVTMPKSVYEVLINSEEQLAEAAKTMEEAEHSEF
jgi:hypothetical protein